MMDWSESHKLILEYITQEVAHDRGVIGSVIREPDEYAKVLGAFMVGVNAAKRGLFRFIEEANKHDQT